MEEHGKGTGTALAQLPTSGALTQSQAMHILKLVYPKAPEEEIIRCAILCRDFGLHPLMKEVYLIPFKDKGGNENYVTVLGINATRKLMAQRGTYSYLDNTPRIMTEQEQKDIFGEVDANNIRAITKLRTKDDLEAQGYGSWPKAKEPYGTDKGNSKANMAFIRSERNAFGRLFTDALPQGVDVIDEAYAEVPDVGIVDTRTGEIIEGEVTELEDGPGAHWCEEHNCAYELKKSKFGEFYAHKQDKGWCNEKKKEQSPAAVAETAPEPSPDPTESTTGAIDPVWLGETLAIIHWTEATALSWIKANLKFEAEGELLDVCNAMPAESLQTFTNHIQTMREAA